MIVSKMKVLGQKTRKGGGRRTLSPACLGLSKVLFLVYKNILYSLMQGSIRRLKNQMDPEEIGKPSLN